MTGWLSLTPEQRRSTLEQAAVRSGIQSKAIEKDWWVTLCLKALFNTPHGSHCIFKGGTSLSKGWKLIQRFSEDIDIALDPEAFGMEYKKAPSYSYVKQLKRKGCKFTSAVIKDALKKAFIELGVPAEMVTIEAEAVPNDRPDKDPQILFIRYVSIFEPHPYLPDEVKIEFGVRSLREPFAKIPVQSILSEVFPNPAYVEAPFNVVAVEPRKTLLEKVFLLHEKFSLDYPKQVQGDRQSRHLYDIVSLMETPAARTLLEDRSLYDILLEHRRHYVRSAGINYQQLYPHNLRFTPTIESVEIFREDYEEMQRSMIYGDSPNFDDLMRKLKLFNGRFRLMGSGFLLEDILEQFLTENNSFIEADPECRIISLPIKLKSASGEIITYQVRMHKIRGPWVFEEIRIAE